MSEKAVALNSSYVSEGIRPELTPAQILDALTENAPAVGDSRPSGVTIVDETVDPEVRSSEPAEGDACE